PPPPDLRGAFCTTVTAALLDNPLREELQLKANDRVPATTGSVMDCVPLVGFAPDQPSPGLPPLALQPVAPEELQLIEVGCPTSTVPGVAESVTLTGGHDQATEVEADASVTPLALQRSEYATESAVDSANVIVPL